MGPPSQQTYKPTPTNASRARQVAIEILGVSEPDDYTVVNRAVERGFDSASVTRLAQHFQISSKEMLDVVDISQSTFSRRKREDKPLTSDESDRLFRVTRLFARAIDVLGDEAEARRWMRTPKRVLDGISPLQLAKTDAGALEVDDLLGRIEYGIPS